MPKEKIEYEDLLDMETEYDEACNSYLRDNGWKHTCDTPGSVWLWQKLIDGRLFAVHRDAATQMQDYLDHLESEDEG